jgi:hypothetical protein
VAQHQRADPALGRDLARLPRGQVPEGRGQLGLVVQERRLAHDQVGPLGQRERAVAEPGVHDEREPLPGPGLAHLVQADSPARHVQATVAGQPSHVRPADAEGGQPVRPHPAPVRLGQLVAHGRHPVRQRPGQQPPGVRLRQHVRVARDRAFGNGGHVVEVGGVPQMAEVLLPSGRIVAHDVMGHPVQGHPLQYARQPQAVVAVEVGDADPVDLAGPHARQQHLPLGALARVEQQALAVPPQQVTVVVAGPRGRLARGPEDHQLPP